MIVDITNEVITKLKTELFPIKVLDTFQSITATFPCVTVEEIVNIDDVETKDTSGIQYSDVTLQIDIFSNTNNKVTETKQIRNIVDGVLSDLYGMNRIFSKPIPNYADENIYRYTLRYRGIINSNKQIYGR